MPDSPLPPCSATIAKERCARPSAFQQRGFARQFGFVLAFALFASALRAAEPVRIFVDQSVAPAVFAAEEIAGALRAGGDTPEIAPLANAAAGENDRGARIVLQVSAEGATAAEREGFVVQRSSDQTNIITIAARDLGGLMYGGLEVAEQIRIAGIAGVTPMERRPHFGLRGVKFNLPLDVRTPSYTDMSDSAQANIPTVWDYEFWREYLDRLARARYNYVSLWNLHPFPSLVQVPGYEDIALDDVWRSTGPFQEDYSTRTVDVVNASMLENVEVVRRMTIADKIAFWRRVMEYGRERNIDFYIITWNLYTFGTDGKHGITEAIDNASTIDYFRQSVAALFRTYPLLRGIGVTAGENLGDHNADFETKEDWLLATYGQGVLDVTREQPGRPIRFIHRQHEARTQDIVTTFAPLVEHPDIEFIFSFKYAQAHALSSTTQTFHRDFVPSLGDVKTLWTLRNDDALLFRWGAPDFVRTFIANMPQDVTAGVYYGSDMWIWGREFLSLDPEEPRQLEIAKHWFHWMLWGRLAYDPTIDNARFAAILAQRFPQVEGTTLLEAWQHASMIYPLTTGFHWGQFDFQWYIEGCRSRPGPAQTTTGFHDVNRFITLSTHPGTDNLTIPAYVESVVAGKTAAGTTPLQVAERLHEHAAAALTAVATMDAGSDRELQETLADIRAMAQLGHYYGHKIAGATDLALFRRTGDAAAQARAVEALTRAAEHWRQYTDNAAARYRNPVWTNRVGHVNWSELRAEVIRDIALARESARP